MEGSHEKKDFQSETRGGTKRDEIFTKIVRAGTRTYYFDVRTIRDNSRFITITESKRKFDTKGNPFYMKHKIFIYSEDFQKFSEGLRETILVAEQGEALPNTSATTNTEVVQETVNPAGSEFTDFDFDDLGEK